MRLHCVRLFFVIFKITEAFNVRMWVSNTNEWNVLKNYYTNTYILYIPMYLSDFVSATLCNFYSNKENKNECTINE